MSTDVEIAGVRTAPVKRKRNNKEDEEIEIDVSLPEPPSKKAKRKEKKLASSKKRTNFADEDADASNSALPEDGLIPAPSSKAQKKLLNDQSDLLEETTSNAKSVKKEKHGEHGVWIGNLPFTATRDSIRAFLEDKGGIESDKILRLHLPGPTKQNGSKTKEQHNRGFAYVDFTDQVTTEKVIALSEKLLEGRALLIKDAKNYEGRPKKVPESDAAEAHGGIEADSRKTVSKRVFIGNLGFDVTKEEIYELYAPAGEVEDVFLATFEDSGKCKGFGWVTFASTTAAEAAVKGYLYREALEDEDDEERSESGTEIVTEKKKAKPRRQKTWVNRINGRDVRCEFAEDPQTRYKKRFGKDKPRDDGSRRDAITERDIVMPHNGADALHRSLGKRESFHQMSDVPDDDARKSNWIDRSDHKPRPQQNGKPDKEERRAERRKKHDARTVAPGKALANTQRATGAIVAGSGKKVTFE